MTPVEDREQTVIAPAEVCYSRHSHALVEALDNSAEWMVFCSLCTQAYRRFGETGLQTFRRFDRGLGGGHVAT